MTSGDSAQAVETVASRRRAAATMDTPSIVGGRHRGVKSVGRDLEEPSVGRYGKGRADGHAWASARKRDGPGAGTSGVRSLPGLAVALWLGAMAFFAFFVAPAAFRTLEREAAGRLVTAIFPRYYEVGAALGLLALVGCAGRGAQRGWDWLPLALVALMLALTVYAWLVVLPAAHEAREALRRQAGGQTTQEALRFARLHRLSSALNGVVMLAGVAFLVMEVTRRP
jgi:uncharacterized membrane protein